MTTMPFEIRIALFGGAGSGKTTLLNALVRDNYGSAVLTKRKVTDVIQYRVNITGKIERESYVIPDLTLVSEETIKLSDGQEMSEVLFDIQVEQAFVETRDDTRFVFVCVPDGEDRFNAYTAEKWDTFDAAFIIIDGKKGYVCLSEML
jgi:GTPase SAR1 family protein